jgi:hypothetical protein
VRQPSRAARVTGTWASSLTTLAIVSNEISPADRRTFLTEWRRASVFRFDTLHSPHYDEHWGTISPSHEAFVTRLARLIRPGGEVLDAACGTGKYWPALLAAVTDPVGLTVAKPFRTPNRNAY